MKRSINDKPIYGVYDGKAYLLDGEPRDYPEAVKRAYADILIDASPEPEAEDEIPETITDDPEIDDPDGGY